VAKYYLLGSYAADATPVPTSDIDLVVVFKGSYRDAEEEEAARRARDACQMVSPIRLDIMVESEARLRAEDVRLKLGSVLVYGEDIRGQIPLPDPAAHTRYITNWANIFIARLHDTDRATFPLRYPDPDGAFFGYDRKRVDAWYPPEVTQGTKELVATVCWTATALLSLQAGQFAGTRADAVRLYAEAVGDEWAPFVQNLYTQCKGQWRYRVPEAADERRELRALCARTLSFLNHYLELSRAYQGQL
jgi:predicted nucleotidyltransferase